jgi:hypothetical protein
MGDPIDKLKMPASAVEALARAVPDDVVRALLEIIIDVQRPRRLRRKVLLTSWLRSLIRRLINAQIVGAYFAVTPSLVLVLLAHGCPKNSN